METSKRMKSGNVNKWNFFVREIDIVAPTRNSNCDFETERKSYCTYDILVLFILLSIHDQNLNTATPTILSYCFQIYPVRFVIFNKFNINTIYVKEKVWQIWQYAIRIVRHSHHFKI